MENIAVYILLSKKERQQHLKLEQLCSEIGGDSVQFRGLLAYSVKTTIPSGQGILLCHACGNGKCSNVNHLYWGTTTENIEDAKIHGTWKNRYQRALDKHGQKEMSRILSEAGKASANKRRITTKEMWESRRELFDSVDKNRRGWVTALAKKTGLSHTQIRRGVAILKSI